MSLRIPLGKGDRKDAAIVSAILSVAAGKTCKAGRCLQLLAAMRSVRTGIHQLAEQAAGKWHPDSPPFVTAFSQNYRKIAVAFDWPQAFMVVLGNQVNAGFSLSVNFHDEFDGTPARCELAKMLPPLLAVRIGLAADTHPGILADYADETGQPESYRLVLRDAAQMAEH